MDRPSRKAGRSRFARASCSSLTWFYDPTTRWGLERLTEPEKKYLQAMVGLGPCPSYRPGDVAAATGKRTSQLGPTREALIAKGMTYSPGYGHAAFTVPLFDDFMRRIR